MLWRLVLSFVFVGLLVSLDQVSKILAYKRLNKYFGYTQTFGIFKFVLVTNTGAAFGFMRNRAKLLKTITVIMILFLVAYTTRMIIIKEPLKVIIPMLLVMGGSVGNMADRFLKGFVIDFISFRIKVKRLPVFNFADFFILSGCMGYLLQVGIN